MNKQFTFPREQYGVSIHFSHINQPTSIATVCPVRAARGRAVSLTSVDTCGVYCVVCGGYCVVCSVWSMSDSVGLCKIRGQGEKLSPKEVVPGNCEAGVGAAPQEPPPVPHPPAAGEVSGTHLTL